jgi:hypothetical protein
MKLTAYITPDQCPFLETRTKVVNRKVVRVKGGYVTLYVTPDLVVVSVRTMAIKESWDKINSYNTQVYEVRTKIEMELD